MQDDLYQKMQPCKNFQIFDDGEGPLETGARFPHWLRAQPSFFCACGLVEVEEREKGEVRSFLPVTYFYASKFQELIPIMISHLETGVCF